MPTASIVRSICSGVVTMLGPNRSNRCAYGVTLAAIRCSARSAAVAASGSIVDIWQHTTPADRPAEVGVTSRIPSMPARPSLSWLACSVMRAAIRSRPIRRWNSNASRAAHRCSKEW